MKNKMFNFFMVSDVISQIITMNIALLGVLFFSKRESWVYLLDIVFVSVLNYSGSTGYSFMHYGRYMNFGFCRKRFYREQVLLSVVRGSIYALARTVLQMVYREEYIVSLVRDTPYTADMYGQIPVVELFVFNLGFFVLLNLILLVTIPCRLYPFISNGEDTPQIKYRKQLTKSNNPSIWKAGTVIVKICGGILIIAFSIIISYPDFVYQIYNKASFRQASVLVMLVLCIICILLGRKKFRPENI